MLRQSCPEQPPELPEPPQAAVRAETTSETTFETRARTEQLVTGRLGQPIGIAIGIAGNLGGWGSLGPPKGRCTAPRSLQIRLGIAIGIASNWEAERRGGVCVQLEGFLDFAFLKGLAISACILRFLDPKIEVQHRAPLFLMDFWGPAWNINHLHF